MNGMNFAKGMGVGLIVGSVVGMTVAGPQKKQTKKNIVGRTLKTMGDIVENIGDSLGM